MPTARAASSDRLGWDNGETILHLTPGVAPDCLRLPRWMGQHGWLILAAFVLLQPLGNSFELPMAIMACLGLWLTLSQRRAVMALPALKPLLLIFACIWLPMLISLTDAVNLPRAAQTTLVFLRFPFAAIFAICVLAAPVARDRLLTATGVGLTLAALGVVILTLTGHSMNGRVTIGFPIGHILAVLSPVYFYWLWRMGQQRRWIWLAAPLYVMAILFTGARVAWIMLAVGLVLWLAQMYWVEKIRWRWKTGMALALLVSIGLGAALYNPGLRAKIVQTAGLFSGNYEKTNTATSLRLPIWRVAWRMTEDHWINGVGPRGFRYLYGQYAQPGDPFMDNARNQGATHPHQLLLEVVTETGIIGLLGYMLALFCWLRIGLAAARAGIKPALPWMAAALVAIMPINAHMAFYGSFWSCITWWLIALSLAHWQDGRVKEVVK